MTLEGAIAVTRFGLGARPGEISLASKDPKKWLKDQLRDPSEFPMNKLLTSQGYILEKAAFTEDWKAGKDDEAKRKVSKYYNKRYQAWEEAENAARFHYATQSPAPFHERLTRFWSNHFSVAGRTRDVLTAAAHEREAIRPYILGTFHELAQRAILHPSMLIYLDNIRSVGPNSIFGLLGRGKKKGLNENLAREVMELHTVTPLAGYSQSDVTELARALTGWGIAAKKEPEDIQGKVFFNPRKHEPSSRTVMGKTYFPIGQSQAMAIIRNLCDHPATAKNISLKLARHFTSDTPPEKLVERLTASFVKTGGDLQALYYVLITSPELWEFKARKAKTPHEMLVSAARYMGRDKVFPTWPRDVFEGFGQTAFKAPTPEGWPDTNSAWLGPDAVMKRVEWANKVAQRNSNLDARTFLDNAVGPRVSTKTKLAIEQAESNQQALTMVLMCPEFQRR